MILESIADGVFTVDRDFIVRSFNRAAEKITGVPREEAIGQPCCEVFRAEICEQMCALKQTELTGKPVVNRPVYIVRADGSEIPISVSAMPLKDEDGTIIGGVETFRELTQVEEFRKQLERSFTFRDMLSQNRRMQELFELRTVLLPAHLFQDMVADMLEGNIKVRTDLFLFKNGINQPVREVIRMAVQEAYPLDSINGSKVFEKYRKVDIRL